MIRQRTLLALEREGTTFFRRIKRRIDERAVSIHPELSGPAYVLLSWIHEQGPVRGVTCSDHFHMDKAAISRQVAHLEELGLVRREPDPEDGRAALLCSTPLAKKLLVESAAETRARFFSQLDDWSDEELESFVGHLTRLNRLGD